MPRRKKLGTSGPWWGPASPGRPWLKRERPETQATITAVARWRLTSPALPNRLQLMKRGAPGDRRMASSDKGLRKWILLLEALLLQRRSDAFTTNLVGWRDRNATGMRSMTLTPTTTSFRISAPRNGSDI